MPRHAPLSSADDVELEAYTVAASSDNCLLWLTGRGNLWRTGTVEP